MSLSGSEKTLTTLDNIVTMPIQRIMFSRRIVLMIIDNSRRVDVHRGDIREHRKGSNGGEVLHSFERKDLNGKAKIADEIEV
jgi:hypothetical protein